ncbi:hypothetical protein HaloA020_35590 [Halomonas sp. A020]|uniref:FkbM family methyltransferase n=1 Tax=Halomonas sp. A020 TaxID=2717374 RepID=UPI002492F734|nr:FkbM family methyltransferase [Halomonas sp. A020]BCB62858.1 hypothetical protein HaloA020_35590 [Halomonas sp. A020]
MNCFLWTEASQERYKLTLKQEPFQPFLFLSFLEFSQAQIVLDIGANVGMYSLLSTLADSVDTIYAFEPEQVAYKALEKNILLNGVGGKVQPSNYAISEKETILKFATHAPMAGVNGVLDSSIHDSRLFNEFTDVEAVSVDGLEGLKGKVLGIKIDVEGHELNVVHGAKQTLLHSPAIVQVEHYLGGSIDRELSELGYFRIFAAGHDHYFTNIKNFANPLFVMRAIEYAGTLLVESQAGRWPMDGTIKYAVSLSAHKSDGKVKVSTEKDSRFFSEDVEYAFYLLENGKKVDEVWYTPEPYTEFPFNEKAESIEVKGFVRERKVPEKKAATGLFVKKPVEGYRAESAVDEALGLPSQYTAVANQLGGAWLGYSDLNLAPLLQVVADEEPKSILQLGGDLSAFAIARKLKQSHRGHLNVLYAQGQAFSFKQCYQSIGEGSQVLSRCMSMHSVSSAYEFETTLRSLIQHLHSVVHVLIRGQFLVDIGISVAELIPLFIDLPKGSKLYTEGLANTSYRQELTELSAKYDVTIEWLYPHSTIKMPGKLSFEEPQGVTDNGLWAMDETLEQSAGLLFSATSDDHPERAFGLDFSLPESRDKGNSNNN